MKEFEFTTWIINAERNDYKPFKLCLRILWATYNIDKNILYAHKPVILYGL